MESLRQMMPENDLWPIDKETWDYMDGNGFHLMTTLYDQMIRQYGEPKDIEDYARKGQLVGAINSKSIWEVWNENKLNYGDRWCSGLLFWYHNCPNMQVCARMWDWMLEPTASLYHTMHALEPLHVQFDYLTNTVSVVNDFLIEKNELNVTAEVYNLQSRLLSKQTAKVNVPADGVANDVLTIKMPDNLTPVHFIALRLTDKQGNLLSRNFYWRSLSAYEGKKTVTGPCTGGFESLENMPAASPSVKITPLASSDGTKKWKLKLRNTNRRIAFFVQFLLTDEKCQPIHATHYSDNFVTLLPGERMEITIETSSSTTENYKLKINEGLHPSKVFDL